MAHALDLSEDRLSLALESGRMGSWNWNLSTDELGWTPTCKAMFGMPADALVTWAMFIDRLHPEDRDRVDALCRAALDPAIRAPYDAEYRIVGPSGGTRWILSRGKAYFDGARAVRFTGTLVDVTEQKEAEAHLRLLVNELAHRVKNTLTVVQSITERTFRGGGGVDGIRQALGGRLQALADTHTLLTLSNWQSVDFGSLVSRSTGHLVRDDSARFRMDGPTLALAPKAGVALGLVLHELGVNAVKHGAWSVEGGSVSCLWAIENQTFRLEWSESGISGLAAPTRKGFGAQLVNRFVAYDLKGEARQIWRPEGLLYVLKAPIGNTLAE
ncbi:sensor histidine kinase [Rhodoblastus acidophilus]|uniref:sensor histidine kinase n=1 Tax=Rhodoblastus acidophilus TaxID=1074 RepID=UPI0022254969|nr:HWE histidine kinase domain-containing protein [Rhodoblastus acidophilus]